MPCAAGVVRALNVERAKTLRGASCPGDRYNRAAGKRLPANRGLEIYVRRLKSQTRVVTDGEVTTGKKPFRVIGVIAHLQRQTRAICAYERKVLKEHSVAADIQT